MKGLPEPEIYEKELEYWPYKDSINAVIDLLVEESPENGQVIDLMCEPGYLLGKLSKRRPDLRLTGLDIDPRYISFARDKYPRTRFVQGDVLAWQPLDKYDVVTCTGLLHHIPYELQESAVQRMAAMTKDTGFLLVSDCYIDDYDDEQGRKLAAAKLGYKYLVATIRNDAPDPIIAPTIEVLDNDVFMREFKTNLRRRLPIFEKYFRDVQTYKTWPQAETEYGDYITVIREKH